MAAHAAGGDYTIGDVVLVIQRIVGVTLGCHVADVWCRDVLPDFALVKCFIRQSKYQWKSNVRDCLAPLADSKL